MFISYLSGHYLRILPLHGAHITHNTRMLLSPAHKHPGRYRAARLMNTFLKPAMYEYSRC